MEISSAKIVHLNWKVSNEAVVYVLRKLWMKGICLFVRMNNENVFLNLGDLDITINVNYGENEIKMTQETDSDEVHADFFIIFNSEKERNEFLSGWAKFYTDVSISLDI